MNITVGAMFGYDDVDLSSGKPVVDTPNIIPFPFTPWAGSGSPMNSIRTSDPCLVYTDGEEITQMILVGVEINDVPIGNQTIEFNKVLKKNIPYTLTVTFRQIIELDPPIDNTYVGAFWRASQIGERIIRITGITGTTNLGAWTAEVVEYDKRNPALWDPAGGDGVVLANVGSSDPRIKTYNSDTAGDAESFLVTGSSTISGTVTETDNYIVFRIGLQKTGETVGGKPRSSVWDYTDSPSYSGKSYPARYAVVHLYYGSPVKLHKIYLRQGEGADYLMRPTDAINSTGMNNPAGPGARPSAVRFSPYNLTGATLNADVGINGGIFTDYPTKAGAFFQWANNGNIALGEDRYRFAWDPFTTLNAALSPAWNATYNPDLWSVIGSTHETCPVNYRRPNDGTITSVAGNINNATAVNSEMRQSLFLTPEMGTFTNGYEHWVMGFYADGYFDRFEISQHPSMGSGGAPSAVKVTGVDIAYRGYLAFNDNSNASLFFPAAGYRSSTLGYGLAMQGWYAYCLNSTRFDGNTISGVRLNGPTTVGMTNESLDSAYPIRCVRE